MDEQFDGMFCPGLLLLIGLPLLELVDEDLLDLAIDHNFEAPEGLLDPPDLIAPFEKLIEVLPLGVLLLGDEPLEYLHELGLLDLQRLPVEDLFDVRVLLSEVVVAELAALDFVRDRHLQTLEPPGLDLREPQVLVVEALAVQHFEHPEEPRPVVVPTPPLVE
jgi:hypothetical protein